jgi:hypothetical protein
MLSWIVDDDEGRSYILRAGTGAVSAVSPVGIADEHGDYAFHAVEIDIDQPKGRARAIRLTTHGRVVTDDPLHEAAVALLQEQAHVSWSIAWHRHPWIPADVPITSLNLRHDAESWLVSIDQADVDAAEEAHESASPEADGGAHRE